MIDQTCDGSHASDMVTADAIEGVFDNNATPQESGVIGRILRGTVLATRFPARTTA